MLGLPWSNAQKITIGSDEHILDTTINRGLIMLLQNDYYLETRGHILSQEIAEIYDNHNEIFSKLVDHINNESMHHGDTGGSISYSTYQITNAPQYTINVSKGNEIDLTQLIKENTTEDLTEDTICFLPIDESPAVLNEKINSIPKNLNGNTVFFVFIVPTGYHKRNEYTEGFNTLSAEYVLRVENDSIKFENFSNGTIIILGDYLYQTTINGEINFPGPVERDTEDMLIKDKFINSVYKEITNPEDINDIINYQNSKLNKEVPVKNLKKTIIRGSCLNPEYSLLSLTNVTAKVYIKNLSFEHNSETIESDDNISDLTYQEQSLFPSQDKFVLLYPFEQTLNKSGLSPIFGQSLISEFARFSNDPLLELLSTTILNDIEPNVNSIIKGFTTNHSDRVDGKTIFDKLKYNDINENGNVNEDGYNLLYLDLDKIINFDFSKITPSFDRSTYYSNNEFLNEYYVNSIKKYIDGLNEFQARCINFIGVSGETQVATGAELIYRY